MEGCGYRDRYDEFQALGVEIVGVSTSNLSVIADWVEEESFQYEVWRDDNGELGLHYGALTTPRGTPSRITKILDANGTTILEYEAVAVGTHPGQVLEDLQILLAQ